MENDTKIMKKKRQKKMIKKKEEEKDLDEVKNNEHIYLNVKEGKKNKKVKHNNQSLVLGNKGLKINLSAFKQLEIDNSIVKEKNNSFAIRIKHLEYKLNKKAL